jgi:WD40 repeat protein
LLGFKLKSDTNYFVWSPGDIDVSTNTGSLFVLSHTLHTDKITDADWNPAGNLIVTSSLDGTARVWDATDAHTISLLQNQGVAITSVA